MPQLNRVEHYGHLAGGFCRDFADGVQDFEHIGFAVVQELLVRVDGGEILEIYAAGRVVFALNLAEVDLLAADCDAQVVGLAGEDELLAVAAVALDFEGLAVHAAVDLRLVGQLEFLLAVGFDFALGGGEVEAVVELLALGLDVLGALDLREVEHLHLRSFDGPVGHLPEVHLTLAEAELRLLGGRFAVDLDGFLVINLEEHLFVEAGGRGRGDFEFYEFFGLCVDGALLGSNGLVFGCEHEVNGDGPAAVLDLEAQLVRLVH